MTRSFTQSTMMPGRGYDEQPGRGYDEKLLQQWTMMPGRGYDEKLNPKDNDARTGQ